MKGDLLSSLHVGNLVSSVALVAILLLVRSLMLQALRRWEAPSAEVRRRWIVQVRNATLMAFLVGMVIIWAAQIKEVAHAVLGHRIQPNFAAEAEGITRERIVDELLNTVAA